MKDNVKPKSFRKKPVIIQAIQYDGTLENITAILNWTAWCKTPAIYDGMLWIKTLEGKMDVTYGDFIIRGVSGEHYPCKPDIFEQTYEIVP